MKIIIPINKAGSHRTGSLQDITKEYIVRTLGFEPNIDDDPYKVKYSWGFTVDGVECGIWDYKGSYKVGTYSVFGPKEIFKGLFGNYYVD